MRRRLLLPLLAFVLIAAACSNDSGSGDASPPEATTTAVPTTDAPTTTTEAPAPTLPDYTDELAAMPSSPNDATLPNVDPDNSGGVYGFSRYVYQSAGDEILPSLIEGPQGFQTRCQDVMLDCSYLELSALYDSGEEIPNYLRMDRETLGELVDQLGQTEDYLAQFETIDDACAAGMFVSSGQSPNMGIHFYDIRAGNGFDPGHPQMILFAKEGNEGRGGAQLGACVNGAWTGDSAGYEAVGVVFNVAQSDEHPAGFAGDLDNWHIHFNLCQGANVGAVATREICEEAGGSWQAETNSWMMHAYVAPSFDAQGGVFSMFNPSIWPVTDPARMEENFTIPSGDGTVAAPITNFDFGDIVVEAGDTVRFANTDSVPHTVTAGSAFLPELDFFDSGLLGTTDTFDLSFETAGEYDLFCVLHPEMTATVTVS